MSQSANAANLSVPPAALLVLALFLFSPPGQAQAMNAYCPALFDLYRACHSQGLQVDSSMVCREASSEALARALARIQGGGARRSPQTARVLVDLVCGTGCDDAMSRLQPATRQEFTEAFCD